MKWSVVLLLAGVAAAAADAPRPEVEVVRLEAQRKLPGEIGRFTDSRLKLAMRLYLPKATVLDVDPKASEVTGMTDDRKADLLDGKSAPLTAQVEPEGEVVRLELSSRKLPSPEAAEVRVKASLAVTLGRGLKSAGSKGMPFKGGEKVPVGPYTLILRRASLGKRVSVEITSNTADVAGLEVTDAEGKRVRVERTGVSKLINGDVRYSFEASRPAERATVRVTYYEKVEKVAVPVDVKVVLGLGVLGDDTKPAGRDGK